MQKELEIMVSILLKQKVHKTVEQLLFNNTDKRFKEDITKLIQLNCEILNIPFKEDKSFIYKSTVFTLNINHFNKVPHYSCELPDSIIEPFYTSYTSYKEYKLILLSYITQMLNCCYSEHDVICILPTFIINNSSFLNLLEKDSVTSPQVLNFIKNTELETKLKNQYLTNKLMG